MRRIRKKMNHDSNIEINFTIYNNIQIDFVYRFIQQDKNIQHEDTIMKTKKYIAMAMAAAMTAMPMVSNARPHGGSDFAAGALAGCLGLGLLSAIFSDPAPVTQTAVVYQAPVVASAPVVVAPAPVVVAAAPVVYAPAPVIYAPPPPTVVYRTRTVYAPPPRPTHYAPPPRGRPAPAPRPIFGNGGGGRRR